MPATSKPADAYAGSAIKARGAGQYLPHQPQQRTIFLSYQHKPVMGLIEHIYIECLPEHVACWVAMQDAHEPIEADEGKQ